LIVIINYASQAVDFKYKEKLAKGTRAAYDTLREKATFMENDRVIYLDMDEAKKLVREGTVLCNVGKDRFSK